MAIDIFANNASAAVSAGGTTAPAAGTSEAWTLSSIVGLVASTGVTQMRLTDPVAPSEIMLLTNLSGAAATVTRGAEGTAPVAHAAGFTVQAVATAAALAALVPGDLDIVWPNTLDGATCRWGGGTASQNDLTWVMASPFTLLRPCTISSIQIEVTTAGAVGAKATLGFYACDGRGRPGTLLQQSGTVDCTTTGAKTLTLSTPLVLTRPQLIFTAMGVNDTSIAFRGNRSTVGYYGAATGNRGPLGDNVARTMPYGYAWAMNGTFDVSPTWSGHSNELNANVHIDFSDAG